MDCDKPAFDESKWTYERSSGWPGYRNIETGQWIYKEDYDRRKDTRVVHFFAGDPNFCKSKEKGRKFGFNIEEINCPKCRENYERNNS